MKDKKGNRRVGLVLSAILISLAISLYFLRQKAPLEVRYREARVERGDLAVTVLATGTVQPENRLEIKPPVPGRIEQILVKEGQMVRRGQVLAWMSSTERAALLDAARAQGVEELKKWEGDYKPTPILAPINGTIILKNVESGQTFSTNDAVLVMSDRLTVKAQVDETDIAQIAVNERALVILDAYPKQKIPGHVDQIAYDAKTVNNVTTYVVDVLPKETPDFMRSGMTANVTFEVSSKRGILLIPSEALRVRDGNYSVLIPGEKDAVPVDRWIETGMTDGKRTEVTHGLSEGEKILIAEIKPLKNSGGEGKNPFAPGGMRRGGR